MTSQSIFNLVFNWSIDPKTFFFFMIVFLVESVFFRPLSFFLGRFLRRERIFFLFFLILTFFHRCSFFLIISLFSLIDSCVLFFLLSCFLLSIPTSVFLSICLVSFFLYAYINWQVSVFLNLCPFLLGDYFDILMAESQPICPAIFCPAICFRRIKSLLDAGKRHFLDFRSSESWTRKVKINQKDGAKDSVKICSIVEVLRMK